MEYTFDEEDVKVVQEDLIGGGDNNGMDEVQDLLDVNEDEPMEEDDYEPEIVGTSFKGQKNVLKNPLHSHTFSKPKKQPVVGDVIEIDLTNDDEITMAPKDMDDSDVVYIAPTEDDFIPELIEDPQLSKTILAEEKKKIGNDHFKRGDYNQALAAYSKAIEYVPTDASYYGNRSACYLMMKKFTEALHDSQYALQLDPTFEKSYLRIVRAHLALGEVQACEAAVDQCMQNSRMTDISLERHKLQDLKKYLNELQVTYSRQDFRRSLYICERILEISTGDLNMRLRKAQTLNKLGRHSEAGEIAAEVMTIAPRISEAYFIRAICNYQLDNMDKSISFFKGGLQYNPDAEEPKTLYRKVKLIKQNRDTATSLYKQGKYEESKAMYTECIKMVTEEGDIRNTGLESKFYFNLSLIYNKLRKYDDALLYAGKAIALNPSYFKAYIHRATIHNAKDMYEEAARDYEAALKLDPSKRELRNEIQHAKMAAKKAKRKDYYKILDIHKTAAEDEIRKAYKKRALMHHPDRHAGSSEAVQKEQEKHFKDVGEAYEVLSDPKKRFRYDQGHDLLEASSHSGCSGGSGATFYDGYDPNQLFNMFFSNGNTGYTRYRSNGRGGGANYH